MRSGPGQVAFVNANELARELEIDEHEAAKVAGKIP